MRTLCLASAALLFACGNDAPPQTIVDKGDEIITHSSPVTAESGWFNLHAGESYTAAESQGLGVTLIRLDLKANCRDWKYGCFFAGGATATVDRETAAAPQPVYSQVEAQHFAALDDKTLVDFAGAASDATANAIVGTFRLRAMAEPIDGVLGATYSLSATTPIYYPDESLTVKLGAVEFASECPCEDPCAKAYCACVLGTSIKVTVLLQTADAAGVVVVPGSFGGYRIDFDGNGHGSSICFDEVPYKSTFSVYVKKQ